MKLGLFDSGLGGLLLTKAIAQELPGIDLVYFGDTLHLPYGNRSDEAIYIYTKRAIDYLFNEQDCALIVTACNTVSAAALRRLQQEYLPKYYPGRNVIGVVVPTLESALNAGYKNLGLIATNYIVGSHIYELELQKIDPDVRLYQKATPLLVPIIEHEGMAWADDILRHYLEPLINAQIECLILGCTHYPFLKPQIERILGGNVKILAQDEIIPPQLAHYLERHPEYADKISQNGLTSFLVSDLTQNYIKTAQTIYGDEINIQKVIL